MPQPSHQVVTVIAKELGFYDGSRRRAGSEFQMLVEIAWDEDGSGAGYPILPSWVEIASDGSRALFKKRQAAAEDKALRAALVANGPKVSKHGTFIEAMNSGRGPQSPGAEKAAGAARAASGEGASAGEAKLKNQRAEALVRHEKIDEDRK